jgi:hypothetical protein
MTFAYPPSKRPKRVVAEKYGHPIGPERDSIHGILLQIELTLFDYGRFLTVEGKRAF